MTETWQADFINAWNVGMRYRANDFNNRETIVIQYLRAAARIISIIESEIRKYRG